MITLIPDIISQDAMEYALHLVGLQICKGKTPTVFTVDGVEFLLPDGGESITGKHISANYYTKSKNHGNFLTPHCSIWFRAELSTYYEGVVSYYKTVNANNMIVNSVTNLTVRDFL